MYSYLFDRKQRTKTSIFYSSWQDILSSIPQDKFFYLTYLLSIKNIDYASYVDDNTPYTADESAKKIIDKLEIETKCLF